MHPAEPSWIRAISFGTPAEPSEAKSATRVHPPRHGHLAWVLCLAVLVAGCTAPPPDTRTSSCPAGQGSPMMVFELYFGRSIDSHGEVSDRAWDDFLDQVVTPNLPDGYTVFDAAGAWMNPATRHTAHERTKVLQVALPDAAGSSTAIARIRQAYATQFHQSSVGMTVAPACGAF